MKLEGLAGRVAVITGAGGYLGGATVRRFLAEGVRVAAVDIAAQPMAALRDAPLDADLELYDVDLASETEVATLARQVLERFGQVDFLLNIAGGEVKPSRAYPDARPSPGMHAIDELTLDDWLRTLSINLTSAFLCCRAFTPHLRTRGRGRIVNFASFATRHGSVRVGVHYAAAKGGIVGLTKTLALELAPFGVTVNAVAPGLFPRSADFDDELGQVAKIPLGRPGTADEIASTLAVLCSDSGSYTSGLTLDVNGGLYVAP